MLSGERAERVDLCLDEFYPDWLNIPKLLFSPWPVLRSLNWPRIKVIHIRRTELRQGDLESLLNGVGDRLKRVGLENVALLSGSWVEVLVCLRDKLASGHSSRRCDIRLEFLSGAEYPATTEIEFTLSFFQMTTDPVSLDWEKHGATYRVSEASRTP
jgi:hypothetical protein